MSYILKYLKRLFLKAPIGVPAAVSKPPPPVEIAPPDVYAWTARALNITMDFEGNDGFATIVGNFDQMGLTCGALGWPIGVGRQQPLVRLFVNRHGREAFDKILGPIASEYWKICNTATLPAAVREVSSWSTGAQVKSKYRFPLMAFWGDPRMVKIQQEEAVNGVGRRTMAMAEKFASQMKVPLRFQHFAWFFDLFVMNGSLEKVWIDTAKETPVKIIMWCKTVFGAGHLDTRRNADVWEKLLPTMNDEEMTLFKMGFARAQTALPKYRTAVMNRRGILACGKGYTEGSLKKPDLSDTLATDQLMP